MTPYVLSIYTISKDIYALFGKIYTNLHNVGAGGQNTCNPPQIAGLI